jgi:hypothetical protein
VHLHAYVIQLALVVMPMRRVDYDVAARDAVVDVVEPRCVFANPRF